jgi:hypothetical protein
VGGEGWIMEHHIIWSFGKRLAVGVRFEKKNGIGFFVQIVFFSS